MTAREGVRKVSKAYVYSKWSYTLVPTRQEYWPKGQLNYAYRKDSLALLHSWVHSEIKNRKVNVLHLIAVVGSSRVVVVAIIADADVVWVFFSFSLLLVLEFSSVFSILCIILLVIYISLFICFCSFGLV